MRAPGIGDKSCFLADGVTRLELLNALRQRVGKIKKNLKECGCLVFLDEASLAYLEDAPMLTRDF